MHMFEIIPIVVIGCRLHLRSKLLDQPKSLEAFPVSREKAGNASFLLSSRSTSNNSSFMLSNCI